MKEAKRIVTALRYCAEHLYSCEGCPEYDDRGPCMLWPVQIKAADMIEYLAAELEEEKRKNGGAK